MSQWMKPWRGNSTHSSEGPKRGQGPDFLSARLNSTRFHGPSFGFSRSAGPSVQFTAVMSLIIQPVTSPFLRSLLFGESGK